eukprot:CAMPEP_0204601298 /NCGR_PEP_ID=MMETSP0661-20131031/55948_1 /ASSEMBLY_ACC=CAM_ASM_000606 /TAXON_ID=109239 /ORGANISM="Alexandrium margalefi, Strain AMGDE01CS-322" /LENGTH=47 /DNA_ID= /DNA_START= /DNA_END= /DNA_ORIENTATION=
MSALAPKEQIKISMLEGAMPQLTTASSTQVGNARKNTSARQTTRHLA